MLTAPPFGPFCRAAGAQSTIQLWHTDPMTPLILDHIGCIKAFHTHFPLVATFSWSPTIIVISIVSRILSLCIKSVYIAKAENRRVFVAFNLASLTHLPCSAHRKCALFMEGQ